MEPDKRERFGDQPLRRKHDLISENKKSFVIIIGAMKSATTTLFDLLSQHPKICPARNKEPGFFAFEEKWALGPAWYDSLFDFDPRTHEYRLEASTDYTKHPFCTNIPQRMMSFENYEYKLLYIIRHPLRRIESHAKHTHLSKKEVGQCISPIENHDLDAGISPVNVATSKYGHQIQIYDEFYKSGKLLVLTFEELRKNQDSVVANVLNFLDLPTFSAKQMHSNSARDKKRLSPTGIRLRKFFGNTPLSAITPPQVKEYMLAKFKESASVDGRFHLTKEEEDLLLQELKSDLSLLHREYGIDVERLWDLQT